MNLLRDTTDQGVFSCIFNWNRKSLSSQGEAKKNWLKIHFGSSRLAYDRIRAMRGAGNHWLMVLFLGIWSCFIFHWYYHAVPLLSNALQNKHMNSFVRSTDNWWFWSYRFIFDDNAFAGSSSEMISVKGSPPALWSHVCQAADHGDQSDTWQYHQKK